jgi:hypothetical protein
MLISVYLASIVIDLAFSSLFSLNAVNAQSSIAIMQGKAWAITRSRPRARCEYNFVSYKK